VSEATAPDIGDDLTAVVADLNSPAHRMDPYPYYRRLRERLAIPHTPDHWLLSRHGHCDAVLRDRRWERLEELMCLPDRAVCSPLEARAAADASGHQQFVLDLASAPSRARLRALFKEAFSAAVVRGLRPRIHSLTRGLLDRALEAREVDLVEALAIPLPGILVCELLGVPAGDWPLLRGWSDAMVRSADPLLTMSAEEVAAQDRAGRELGDYFRPLIAARRARPSDDLLGRLALGRVTGEALDEQELIAACVMLLVAGQEMISNFIGLGALALLRHPAQRRRLQAQPGLIPSAVEELLRYDSPAQIAPRVALEDRELDGERVAAQSYAVLLLGAANRDPEVFAQPERLDLGRRDNRHLAFGQGHLFCPGAPLARLQGGIAFGALAARAPALELTGEPERKGTFCIRGLAKLPVLVR